LVDGIDGEAERSEERLARVLNYCFPLSRRIVPTRKASRTILEFVLGKQSFVANPRELRVCGA
jgi:hypothetical protein